jgi:thiamine-phosphate pyrophosphorylase
VRRPRHSGNAISGTATGEHTRISSPGADPRLSRLDLRLIVITDAALAAPRSVIDVAAAAVAAGAPAIQLRDKMATAAQLAEQARALLPIVHRAGALLFINDRLDVALATGADGVHLGPDDLPVAAARRVAPAGMLLGFSTDDPVAAARAEREGADYVGCGAVFGTSSKDVGDERIGVERLDAVARAVRIPVVGIGGIGTDNVHEVAATNAAGVAVVGAVMSAVDPAATVRLLLGAFER